jgi:hypothetical protein
LLQHCKITCVSFAMRERISFVVVVMLIADRAATGLGGSKLSSVATWNKWCTHENYRAWNIFEITKRNIAAAWQDYMCIICKARATICCCCNVHSWSGCSMPMGEQVLILLTCNMPMGEQVIILLAILIIVFILYIIIIFFKPRSIMCLINRSFRCRTLHKNRNNNIYWLLPEHTKTCKEII